MEEKQQRVSKYETMQVCLMLSCLDRKIRNIPVRCVQHIITVLSLLYGFCCIISLDLICLGDGTHCSVILWQFVRQELGYALVIVVVIV
jgi:hypothetical protein